jgi:putative ABC transport system permease protein
VAASFWIYCKGFMRDPGWRPKCIQPTHKGSFEENHTQIPLSEFRYALRQLRKSPGFTIVAVLTLALGIGANSAIFSAVYAVLLRPLPFHGSSRLVAIQTTEPGRQDDVGVSYPSFLDWRAQSQAFEGMSAFHVGDFTLIGRGEPVHLAGAVASANLFSVLGVSPALGRGFLSAEDKPGAGLPIVVSHSFWQNHLPPIRKSLARI